MNTQIAKTPKWVFNNDEDLQHFILSGSDVEFGEAFPTFMGSPSDFHYCNYLKARFRSQLNLGNEDLHDIRLYRRAYKIVLSQYHETLKTDKDAECLRCLLIQEGRFMVQKLGMYSCKVKLPLESVITEEDLIPTPSAVRKYRDEGYHDTLALSTALSNVEGSPAICVNVPLPQKIKLQILGQNEIPEFVNPTHKCVNPQLHLLNDSKIVDIIAGKQTQAASQHVLIFASSGFGKTTFQHSLMKQGIVLLDTDDVPGVTPNNLWKLLEVSSVLTNRLDLVKNTQTPVLFFAPETWVVLKNKAKFPNLTDEDWIYWWNEHEISRNNLIKCVVNTTYVGDWFSSSFKIQRDDTIVKSSPPKKKAKRKV